MPSPDSYLSTGRRPGNRTTRLPKPLGWVVVVLVVLVGVVVAYQAVADAELRAPGRGVAALLGAALLLSAVALALELLPTRGRGGMRLTDDGRAIEFAMGMRTPLTMLLVGIGFAGFFLAAGIAVGVPGGGVHVWTVGLLLVILIPDPLRALARKPTLRLSADKVDLHGWTSDVSLAWDDMLTVMYDDTDPIRPRLNLLGRTTAPSFRAVSSRLIVPLERAPKRPEVPVYLAAFSDPERLRALIETLQRMTAIERASWIGRQAASADSGGQPEGL